MTYQEIPIEQIHESKLNPRKYFDPTKLQELTESVKQKGILEPILVRPNAGGFEVVAGARRFRAAIAAMLTTIPAVVRELSDQDALETMVIENLQRDDLHPLEEATGYKMLLAQRGMDVARIAERVGRSVKYVYDRVKLLALTKEAQKVFLDGKIQAGHAILLARLRPEDQARAMDAETGGLFQSERLLWDPTRDGDDEAVKPASVRELQAWIDQHVKFDAGEADPMLFPEDRKSVV